ncbi:PREDICTED: SWI/SNF-related matrix-associated actin-dependent regulator of chromatin subfamily D member 1-like, partial [Priapulus caudatus]|uniref:SWI/SNF-related matrix-associated actin-dependent regulator of chromatin subfamily D member 1-like n=1 Tax=Priapulus caudatus TaxID=37621 RepID=A0ABM1F776_PRICU
MTCSRSNLLDATIVRKRLEIQRPGSVLIKDDDNVSRGAACQAKLLEQRTNKVDSKLPKRKFSSFFKSLVIELDKELYGPENHLVEWHRTATTQETDGFQVKRPGDRNVRCTVLLLLDYQ